MNVIIWPLLIYIFFSIKSEQCKVQKYAMMFVGSFYKA